MGSFGDFSRRISAIADTIERRGPEIVRKTAAVVLQAVVISTPVGNVALWGAEARSRARPGYVGGRARGNWFVGIGAPVEGTSDTIDPGGGSTISAGNSAIASAGAFPIHITNNLPYIVPLNEGHSHQAPIGFVELAIAAGIQSLDGQKITEG